MKNTKRVMLMVLSLVIINLSGCQSIKSLIDFAIDTKEQIDAKKEEKERIKKEEEERKRQEEIERQKREEAAKKENEEAEKQKYAEGPNSIDHGKRNFLWKSVSDNTGKPVVILPPRFSNKTRLLTVNGTKIKLDKVANGYREHYRLNQHYTNTVTVVSETSDGYNGKFYRWTWVITNPTTRNDSNITPTKSEL